MPEIRKKPIYIFNLSKFHLDTEFRFQTWQSCISHIFLMVAREHHSCFHSLTSISVLRNNYIRLSPIEKTTNMLERM